MGRVHVVLVDLDLADLDLHVRLPERRRPALHPPRSAPFGAWCHDVGVDVLRAELGTEQGVHAQRDGHGR